MTTCCQIVLIKTIKFPFIDLIIINNYEVMKKLLLMLLLFIPLMGFCQSEEKQYYIYNIVSFEGDFTKEDFKVYYDDGIEVKRMRNDKGEKARFSTPAGALMYFISQGWEMYLNGATSKGSFISRNRLL